MIQETQDKLPEPTYKHGLKIRIKPTINYKDITKTKPIEITSNATLSKEGNLQDFLTFGDKQYYTDTTNGEIYYITIPENTKQDLHITTTAKEPGRTTINITTKKNSHTNLIITHTGDTAYDAETISINAEEGSHLKIILIQKYGEKTHSFKHCRAKVGKDASVEWISVLMGSLYTHASFINVLSAPGAKGTSTVLYLTRNKQQFDIDTQSIHSNKETYSDIVTKGAVTDYAKALSRGLVRIESNGQGSNGYEKQDALLLSETAEADAIPNLEIHNHDVKCSHGSTIGQCDEHQLFYLMSRGISKEEAIKTLIKGFFNPVLILLDQPTQELLEKEITEAL